MMPAAPHASHAAEGSPPDPNHPWKERVAARFAQACDTYDRAAAVQQAIAQSLAETICAHPLAAAPRVCEIGCGTGFLTAALFHRIAPKGWLATDIAAPMLAATCHRLEAPDRLQTALMDGEHPSLAANSQDLICSSLAVQWFIDLSAGLGRLYQALAPGGLLAVTTLGAESFAPWTAACQREGLPSFSQGYPTRAALQSWCPGAEITEQHWPLDLASDRPGAFLAALRAIGADTPPPGLDRAPLSALRRALRHLADGHGGGYHVLTILWRKPALQP